MLLTNIGNTYFSNKDANNYNSRYEYDFYVLKNGENKPTKILSDNINCISIDKNNNVYLGTDNGVYVLKQGNNIIENSSNFIDKYWQGKKPLLNIGICKNTILLKT